MILEELRDRIAPMATASVAVDAEHVERAFEVAEGDHAIAHRGDDSSHVERRRDGSASP
jgi:hypothetical protein